MSENRERILIVDDEFVTVARLIDDLKEHKYLVDFRPDLESARAAIEQASKEDPGKYGAVLIDLMFKRSGRALEKYERQLLEKSNTTSVEARGQTLGLYLSENFRQLPYAYISLRPGVFVVTGIEFSGCVDRGGIPPRGIEFSGCVDRGGIPPRPWVMSKLDVIEKGDIAESVAKLIEYWGACSAARAESTSLSPSRSEAAPAWRKLMSTTCFLR